jgi:hypothetical protein
MTEKKPKAKGVGRGNTPEGQRFLHLGIQAIKEKGQGYKKHKTRKQSFARWLDQVIAEDKNGEITTQLDLVVMRVIDDALSGSVKAQNLVMDSYFGKMTEHVQVAHKITQMGNVLIAPDGVKPEYVESVEVIESAPDLIPLEFNVGKELVYSDEFDDGFDEDDDADDDEDFD